MQLLPMRDVALFLQNYWNDRIIIVSITDGWGSSPQNAKLRRGGVNPGALSLVGVLSFFARGIVVVRAEKDCGTGRCFGDLVDDLSGGSGRWQVRKKSRSQHRRMVPVPLRFEGYVGNASWVPFKVWITCAMRAFGTVMTSEPDQKLRRHLLDVLKNRSGNWNTKRDRETNQDVGSGNGHESRTMRRPT
jgi:hypothetical protein